MRQIDPFIAGDAAGGGSVRPENGRAGDVFNPSTGQVQARVAFSTAADLDRAVVAAAAAQPGAAA